MNKKIAILTSGHNPFDERLFYKFSHTFKKNNYESAIFCSTENINKITDGITIKGFTSENLNKRSKINKFCDLLIEFKPDIIICAEILPILAANKYKKELNKICKIVYDLTEWYPESYYSKIPKLLYFILYPVLYLFQYYTIQKVDGIIFGEQRKIKRFNFIAPTKKKKLISYYPILKYFNYFPPPFNGEILTLCFTGLFNEARGIFRFISVAEKISEAYSNLKIKIILVGRFTELSSKAEIKQKLKNKNNCNFEIIDWQPYNKISEVIAEADICFDLRKNNFIYNNSLPIKIFEYMACGKPIIYSDIPAIRDLFEDDIIGFFVNPNNESEILEKLNLYISDKSILVRHSKKGRELVEKIYNWSKLEKELIEFITEI